jgi:hypothetical protein
VNKQPKYKVDSYHGDPEFPPHMWISEVCKGVWQIHISLNKKVQLCGVGDNCLDFIDFDDKDYAVISFDRDLEFIGEVNKETYYATVYEPELFRKIHDRMEEVCQIETKGNHEK